MSSNNNQNFINYWDFLEIPMDSPLIDIITAYCKRFNEIEQSLNNKEITYTIEDLIIANNAFATLSDPYKRYLHNCMIDDEDPSRDFSSFYDDMLSYQDSEEDKIMNINESLLEWLQSKINKYINSLSNNSNSKKATIDNIVFGLLENQETIQKIIKNQNKLVKKKYKTL